LDEPEVLVDEAQAGVARSDRVAQRHRLAGQRDLGAGVGLVVARQHLDERRLAAAVLADQRVNLAGRDVEVDAVQGLGAREALAEAADREDGVHRAQLASRAARSLRAAGRLASATAMISDMPWKSGWLQTDAELAD